jgi:hypothetical protein
MIKVIILRDFQVEEGGQVFTRKCSTIEYDTKRPTEKKWHHLVYQQGERYGTVGDCCEYLTDQQLHDLVFKGHVRIERSRRPPRGRLW